MNHDTLYHEFDSEVLYRELTNYQQYLNDCKADVETEGDLTHINTELSHVESILDTLREMYDCE